METDCPDCGYWKSRNARYCGTCGRNLEGLTPFYSTVTPVRSDAGGASSLGVRGMFAVIAYTAVMMVLVITACYVVIHLSDMFGILTPTGMVVLPLATIAFVIVLGIMLRLGFRDLKRVEREHLDPLRSGAVGTGAGVAVMLAISYVYILATAIFGAPIDTSVFDGYTELEMAVSLFIAGPEEEFLFRVLPIGVLMTIVALIARREHPFSYLMGGFGTSRIAWIVIVASALIFGLAHLDNWNLIKVPQAALGGVVFGYLFVRYGLYASIAAHTAIDCMSIVGYTNDGMSVFITLCLIVAGIALIVTELMRLHDEGLKDEGWLGEEPEGNFIERWMGR